MLEKVNVLTDLESLLQLAQLRARHLLVDAHMVHFDSRCLRLNDHLWHWYIRLSLSHLEFVSSR